MNHPRGSVRVVARATAIIQDTQGRFLLTYHAEEGHYFLPGGKVRDMQGNDLARVFTHPQTAAIFTSRLFTMRRESAREAGAREVWEELLELKVVSAMAWKQAKHRFRVAESMPAIKITNLSDAPGGYRPTIDTENVILPCRIQLPRLWDEEIQRLWKAEDKRIWFAGPIEIREGITTAARSISFDVARILTRTGLMAA